MQFWTLDDLRRFAREVHEKIPGIDVTENESNQEIQDRGDVYAKLREEYPFMKWGIGGKGNPYIYDREGTMKVEWGGALPGHWGFAIALDGKRIDPEPDPDTRILRVSDDIYFYDGD